MSGGGGSTTTYATRIGSVQLQSSSYGKPVPIGYGTNRSGGNLVDYDDFQAIEHTSTQASGGKGGAPTQTSVNYTYTATIILAVGEGAAAIRAVYREKSTFTGATAVTDAGLTFFSGSESQAAWGYMQTAHSDKALGYTGTAYLAAAGYDLDSNASVPNHNVEVVWSFAIGGGIDDADASQFLPDFLTHPRYGCGFPVAQIGDLSNWGSYIRAYGLLLSPLLDAQTQASTIVQRWCDLTNAAIWWSADRIKVKPYGDQAITANGTTYTPDLAPIYDLTDDDFLDQDPPVTFVRTQRDDAYNRQFVKYRSRANQYNDVTISADDQATIDLYGLRPANVIEAPDICDADVAGKILQIKLQRGLAVLNVWTFKLGAWAALLEPMDIVTLTDADLGLVRWPVLIRKRTEDDDDFEFEAEDFPAASGHAALYTRAQPLTTPANYNADPGNVAAPSIFEPPLPLTGGTLQVWAAVTGQSAMWGGCGVWASLDGNTYRRIGEVRGGARYGRTTAAIAATDTSVGVQLTGLGGQLLSGTAQDAQVFNTLMAIDGEFLAYQSATLTAANAYTLAGLNRGGYGTTAATHANGAPFVRLDDSISKSLVLDPGYVGKTVYLKFTSFNLYGRAEQPLANVSAYTYPVTGRFYLEPPDALTGVTLDASSGNAAFSWDAPTDPYVTAGGYVVIAYYNGPISSASWAASTELKRFPGNSSGGSVQLLTGTYLLRTLDTTGVFSAIVGVQYGNPAAGGGSGGAGGTLSLVASPANPMTSGNSGTLTTGNVTATANGGKPPYSYAWTFVSGDSGVTAVSPSNNITAFRATGMVVAGSKTATLRCTVTDSASPPATATASVNPSFQYTGDNGGGSGGGAIP